MKHRIEVDLLAADSANPTTRREVIECESVSDAMTSIIKRFVLGQDNIFVRVLEATQ